jgi:hypothetical protein
MKAEFDPGAALNAMTPRRHDAMPGAGTTASSPRALSSRGAEGEAPAWFRVPMPDLDVEAFHEPFAPTENTKL